MDVFECKFKNASAGKLLDVATGCGYFIRRLIESFGEYELAVGIDISDNDTGKWRETLKGERAVFIRMDGTRLAFPDESFNTVSIANSLHHLQDINTVLTEMKRVLKFDGRIIIAEMYRDVVDERQLSHVSAHHFKARVDTIKGISHNETLKRDEIIGLAKKLNLKKYELIDFNYDEADYDSRESAEGWCQAIDKNIARMTGDRRYQKFREEGESIKKRLRETGYHPATDLIIIGNK